jgi:hypothetical protein
MGKLNEVSQHSLFIQQLNFDKFPVIFCLFLLMFVCQAPVYALWLLLTALVLCLFFIAAHPSSKSIPQPVKF